MTQLQAEAAKAFQELASQSLLQQDRLDQMKERHQSSSGQKMDYQVQTAVKQSPGLGYENCHDHHCSVRLFGGASYACRFAHNESHCLLRFLATHYMTVFAIAADHWSARLRSEDRRC